MFKLKIIAALVITGSHHKTTDQRQISKYKQKDNSWVLTSQHSVTEAH